MRRIVYGVLRSTSGSGSVIQVYSSEATMGQVKALKKHSIDTDIDNGTASWPLFFFRRYTDDIMTDVAPVRR